MKGVLVFSPFRNRARRALLPAFSPFAFSLYLAVVCILLFIGCASDSDSEVDTSGEVAVVVRQIPLQGDTVIEVTLEVSGRTVSATINDGSGTILEVTEVPVGTQTYTITWRSLTHDVTLGVLSDTITVQANTTTEVSPDQSLIDTDFDDDGDACTNLTEIRAGTDPMDPTIVAPECDRSVSTIARAGADQIVSTESQVVLDGSGSSDAEGNPLTFNWSFVFVPPGSIATLSDPTAVNPTFTADVAGTYVVGLIVNNGLENSLLDTVTITAMMPPSGVIARAEISFASTGRFVLDNLSFNLTLTFDESEFILVGPIDGITVQGVTFFFTVGRAPSTDASVGISPGPGDTPLLTPPLIEGDATGVLTLLFNPPVDSVMFDFGLSDVVDIPNGATMSIFDASDNLLATASADATVPPGFGFPEGTLGLSAGVDPPPPVANAGADQIVSTGSQVVLDGSGSSDAEGNPLTFNWSFVSVPPGSIATLSDPTAVNPTFTADVAGTYVVGLIVNNGLENSLLDTVTITAMTPPTIIFNADFNADATGQLPNLDPPGLPDGDSIELFNADTGGNSMLIQAPGTGFSTNSLRIFKQASTGNSPIFRGIPDPQFGPYITGVYTVTWSSLSEQPDGGFGFAALSAPGGFSAFTVNYGSDGRIRFQDGTGVIDTGIDYTANTPQTFRAVVDLDIRTFDLFIDNVQVAMDRPLQADAGFTEIESFLWEIGGILTESYAIDEISIVAQ